MQINGLNNLDEEIRPIVLSFIGSHYDESSTLNIDIDDNDLISINDATYYICDVSEVRNIQKDADDGFFEEQIYDCPREWRSYIDKKLWLDDFGLSETEAIARLFDKEDCALIDRVNNYNIYNV